MASLVANNHAIPDDYLDDDQKRQIKGDIVKPEEFMMTKLTSAQPTVINSEGHIDNCAICQLPLDATINIRGKEIYGNTVCGHRLHQQCMGKFLDESQTGLCPCCRKRWFDTTEQQHEARESRLVMLHVKRGVYDRPMSVSTLDDNDEIVPLLDENTKMIVVADWVIAAVRVVAYTMSRSGVPGDADKYQNGVAAHQDGYAVVLAVAKALRQMDGQTVLFDRFREQLPRKAMGLLSADLREGDITMDLTEFAQDVCKVALHVYAEGCA